MTGRTGIGMHGGGMTGAAASSAVENTTPFAKTGKRSKRKTPRGQQATRFPQVRQ